jgi:hypothetical protein
MREAGMSRKLHDEYRGRKLDEKVAGAKGRVKCAFCDKMFSNAAAAAQHERSYHRKKLERVISEQANQEQEPENRKRVSRRKKPGAE